MLNAYYPLQEDLQLCSTRKFLKTCCNGLSLCFSFIPEKISLRRDFKLSLGFQQRLVSRKQHKLDSLNTSSRRVFCCVEKPPLKRLSFPWSLALLTLSLLWPRSRIASASTFEAFHLESNYPYAVEFHKSSLIKNPSSNCRRIALVVQRKEKKSKSVKEASDALFLKNRSSLFSELFRVGSFWKVLSIHIPSTVSDTLVLLLATIIVVPIMRKLNTSPILGFLIAGLVLGPNGFHLVRDVVASRTLAEWGVVFFLFEMGLELSLDRLRKLQKDVFELGLSQFLICGAAFAISAMIAGLPLETCAVIGGGLALSSSAFVLQLLSERGEIGTRFGRASFGILLLQDIAVVPLLVVIPLLATKSGGPKVLVSALMVAAMKASVALAVIFATGRLFLEKVFRTVAAAKSPEAFVGVILFTVLSTSAVTEGLGLSDTLGAFLAGVLLAETKYRHQIEADIAPFRGLLLGLFFITVGFSIDLKLALANLPVVSSLVLGLLTMKAGIITVLARLFGLSFSNAIRTGLLVAQGGEFAFVTFGAAQRAGLLPADLSQLLLLVVALSMATTPLLSSIGSQLASRIERRRGLIGARSEDIADARDFVIVAGFAFDMSPSRVIEARNKGLPVFFGDACRPEVLEAAGVSRAKAVVITLDDPVAASRAVQSLRREYPDLQIFVRARDTKHQQTLQLAGATAIVPELLESSLLLGGAVLLAYGTPIEEVNALIDEARKKTFKEAGLSIGTSALNPRSPFSPSSETKTKKTTSSSLISSLDETNDNSSSSLNESKMITSNLLEESHVVSTTPSVDKMEMAAVEEDDTSHSASLPSSQEKNISTNLAQEKEVHFPIKEEPSTSSNGSQQDDSSLEKIVGQHKKSEDPIISTTESLDDSVR
ncbi:K(+) efflux antiporter 3, chloroplastic [Galdieria sulphuraria]|nr:K(+) efflux antiporter 3, chloroplastic [Galdieria sulphuraria]